VSSHDRPRKWWGAPRPGVRGRFGSRRRGAGLFKLLGPRLWLPEVWGRDGALVCTKCFSVAQNCSCWCYSVFNFQITRARLHQMQMTCVCYIGMITCQNLCGA